MQSRVGSQDDPKWLKGARRAKWFYCAQGMILEWKFPNTGQGFAWFELSTRSKGAYTQTLDSCLPRCGAKRGRGEGGREE